MCHYNSNAPSPALDSYLLTCYYLAVEVEVRDILYSNVIALFQMFGQNHMFELYKTVIRHCNSYV